MTLDAAARPANLSSIPHSGLSVREFYGMHFWAGALPLYAGFMLYGWRAIVCVGLTVLGVLVGVKIWRKIGARGEQMSNHHAVWLAVLLGMMLPAHLASDLMPGSNHAGWPIPLSAGLLLAMLLWLLGGLGGGRISPVVASYLIISALFFQALAPHWVLQRRHLLAGDILRPAPSLIGGSASDSWMSRPMIAGGDSERSRPASVALSLYTRGHDDTGRGWLTIQTLLRDELPPLENMVFGGSPAPIGLGSAIMVIIGGLFLLYRGLIDFRIPLLIIGADLASLLILPIPAVVTDQTKWHWLVSRQPNVGWATGVTFANYEMMASPILFVAFFLATGAAIRPMSRRARTIYSLIAGFGSGALQLYLDVSIGPYVALLLASLLTPVLDVWFRPRPLI